MTILTLMSYLKWPFVIFVRFGIVYQSGLHDDPDQHGRFGGPDTVPLCRQVFDAVQVFFPDISQAL